MECSPVSHTCACAHGFRPAPPSASHTDPLCIKLHPAKDDSVLTYHEDTKVNEKATPQLSDVEVIPVFVPLKRLAEPKRIPYFGDSGHLIQRALEASLSRHSPQSGQQTPDNLPHSPDTRHPSPDNGSSYTLIRSAVKAALNSSEELVGDGGFDEEEKQIQIYWRAGNTMVLLGCLLLCSGLAALLTGLYLRALQEKRASQATLKSLIKFLTDQEKEAGFVHTADDGAPERKDLEKDEPTPTFDYAILDGGRNTLPSRLTLAPLEGSNIVKLPPPQSCHVPLPGIQAKKPNRRERRSYQQLDPTTLMGNPAAATLTQMLANAEVKKDEENSDQSLN